MPAVAEKTEKTEKAVETKEKEKVSYQDFVEARNVLADLMARKKLVDRNLAALENSIYAFEGSYLDDTAHGGNIIRGFEGYVSNKPERGGNNRPKHSDADRLFSMSSTTFTKALQQKENPEPESSQDESKRGSSSKRSHKHSSHPPPSPLTSTSAQSQAAAAAAAASSNRRLLKHQRSLTGGTSGTDSKPSKKIRLSSASASATHDRDGEEDIDV